MRDLAILIGILALAGLLRFEGLSAKGLTHFDEGAYALTAEAIGSGRGMDGWYPQQVWLAPPVFYGVSALGIRYGLDPTHATQFIAAVFGVLGVAAIWCLGRSWSGRTDVAHAVALMLALSPHHLTFSRVGLTDTAFLFWFLVSLLVITAAERRRSLVLSAFAGLAVGVAWNTKYHGWLALVIWFCALLATQRKSSGTERTQALMRLGIAGLTAGLCYLPWYLHVAAQPGGYAALVEQHQSFLKPGNLTHNLRVQLESASFFATHSGWGLALVGAGIAVALLRRRTALLAYTLLVVLSRGEPAWCVPALVVAGLAGLRSAWRGRLDASLGFAFLCCFTLLTPLYHPYARLLLPFVAALPLGASSIATVAPGKRWSAGILVVAVLLGGYALLRQPGSFLPANAAPAGLAHAAAELADELPPDVVCHVLGEPAAALGLRRAGREVRCVNGVSEVMEATPPGHSVWLLTGCYARRTGELARLRERHPEAFRLRATHNAQTGPVRWLDDHTPARLRAKNGKPEANTYELRLFEIRVPRIPR